MARSDRANINSNSYRDETQAELNVLDGVTAGTVTADKALVVDSNKAIATLGDITSSGVIKFNTSSAIEGVLSSATTSSSSSYIASVTLPAKSLLTEWGCVCTTLCGYTNGTLGVAVGHTPAGNDIDWDADGIADTDTSLAVGKGNSSTPAIATALSANANGDIIATKTWYPSEQDVHFTVLPQLGGVSAGVFQCWVKYITLG